MTCGVQDDDDVERIAARLDRATILKDNKVMVKGDVR
jgi:hypothetical protein